MGRKLWGGEVIGEDTPGLKRSRKNKQKVRKKYEILNQFKKVKLETRIVLAGWFNRETGGFFVFLSDIKFVLTFIFYCQFSDVMCRSL
jgi:hypothetical protein